LADTLREELHLSEITVTPGDRGEFTVWADDTQIAKKTLLGFPEPDDVVIAMRKHMSATSSMS